MARLPARGPGFLGFKPSRAPLGSNLGEATDGRNQCSVTAARRPARYPRARRTDGPNPAAKAWEPGTHQPGRPGRGEFTGRQVRGRAHSSPNPTANPVGQQGEEKTWSPLPPP